jgi:pimeloyl-ACP methyl ester carboxylesterase
MTSVVPFPELAGVEHRYVELPGLRMHVAEAGHGEPVLLMHGFPQNWWEWRKVIPRLARRYRVICPDLRGAGWTEAPDGGYDREQLVTDVLALLDELRLDRVHLIAHDWSALVGYELCLYHPERVLSYVSLAVPHPYMRFTPKLLTVMWRLWFQVVIAMPRLGPWLIRRGPLVRYLLRAYAANREAFTATDVELFTGQFRDPARARAASALYRRFILPSAQRIIRGAYRRTRLTTPTQLLYGALDPAGRADFLGGYADMADDLTVIRVEGAAHYIADERSDAVPSPAWMSTPPVEPATER